MPDAECVVLFHVLIDGECVVECQSHPAVKMETGDVIVFPHGHPHTMGSRDAVKATPIGAIFTPGTRDEPPQICLRRRRTGVALRVRLPELRPAVQPADRRAADDAAGAEPR